MSFSSASSATGSAPPAALAAAYARPSLLAALAYVVLSFWIAIVLFVVTVTLLALSVGLLAAFLLGVPLAAVTLWCVRGFAVMERGRALALLGLEIPAPGPAAPPGTPFLRSLGAQLRSGTEWRQVAYCLALLPVSCISFSIVVAAWGTGLGLFTAPAWSARMDRDALPLLDEAWKVVAWTACGALLLALSSSITKVAALVESALAKTLLGRDERAALQARVGTLTETRAEVVAAADAERKRIERDLHDGAQQRLVSLAMSLGRARGKLEDDPQAASKLLDEAHLEAKQALAELRDLARGLHPSVLTDRGLDAALSSVAARSPVPVRLDVDVEPRPAPAVEAVAYFTVVEALANVAKHAHAKEAAVLVRRVGPTVFVEVRDDGRGGADPAGGSGLRGLAGRVAAADGKLTVSSPPGGPTVLRAELPADVPAADPTRGATA
ncbi:sensor histidine kinase [Motilibacter deserti]|uniref:histidine kinase n=1 Tax=Motilibacter deserti TaxID=2714956 RepID=A0ABX0GTW4_9ACTN|nr:sensor histidine kinase [Motilibacter deserti]NHC13269.1 sensor histidine kinase [Motilibacter deserti]